MALEGTQHLITALYQVKGWNLYKQTMDASGRVVGAAYKQQTGEGKKAVTAMKGFTTQTIKGQKVIKPFYNETHKAAKATKTLGHNMNTTKGRTNDLMKALKRAAVVAPIWLALRAVMMKTIQLFKSSVQFLIEWEKQMAQIKIVGKGTAEEYNRLSTSLLNLATSYGISISQLGAGAKLWAQQGKSIAEIIPLMETTIKMSLLTGRTVERSVEDLTAIMKNFGIEANNTEQILDSITNVMLNHAITADTLVAAYKDVASIAATVGVSFEKLTGLITATHVATRAAGSRVGKAWVTIFTRMGTSAVNAIQKIADVPVFMDKLGQASFKSTGILRPMGDVLDEVASKWHTLGNELQVQLAFAIAGRRRLQLFTAAMMQYDEGLNATLHSLDSFGKGQKATNILLDTAAAKSAQLKNDWNSLVDTLTTTQGFKSALDGLKEMVEHLERLSAYGNMKALISPALGMFPGTLQAGKAYDYAKKTQAIRKNETRELDEKTAQYKKMTGQSNQLNVILTFRNRLLKSGVDINDSQIKKQEEWISKMSAALGKEELFIGINTVSIDELAEKLEKIAPELQDKFISAQAEADIKKRKDAILYETNDLVVKYNQRIEQMNSSIPLFVEEPSKVPLEEMKKALEEIESRLAKTKEWAKIPFLGDDKEVMEHEAVKEILESIMKSKEKLNELGEDAVSIRKAELTAEIALANKTLVLRDKKEIFDEKMYELRKKIAKQDIQELEAIQAKIKLYEEYYGKDLGDAAGKTVKSLELQEITLQKKEIENITKALIKHATDLLKLEGATKSQIIEQTMAMNRQADIGQSELSLLKNKLALEAAINEEKIKQNKYSSESVKLYEIYQKYGARMATATQEFLGGKEFDFRSHFGKQLEKILQESFGGRLTQSKIPDWLPTTSMRLKEDTIPEISMQKLQLPAITTKVDKIVINVKQALSEALEEKGTSQSILDSLADAIKTNPKIKEAIDQRIEDY